MKLNNITLFFVAILFTSCVFQRQSKGVIIVPPPIQTIPQEQTEPFDSWEIIMSQNGLGNDGIPGWASYYFDNNLSAIESMDEYKGKYIFIGENRGENFNALQQWANSFAVEYDFSRLVTKRAEYRLVSSARLYPDDEYGYFFEYFILEMMNGDFPGAVKEETFWLLRKMIVNDPEAIIDEDLPQPDVTVDRYEFLVLVSVDKEILRNQISSIMQGIKTEVPPTREQSAAIARIKSTFFNRF
jgi:hypothetical protein